MNSWTHDIALRQSLEDMVEARAKTLKLIADGHRLIREAEDAISVVGRLLFPIDSVPREREMKNIEQALDRRMWRHAFEHTGLTQYMDAKALAEFRSSLERDPPAFTMENARTALLSAAQDADMMFARGLVNLFLGLSKEHKTNTKEPFKVSRKAIRTWVFDTWYSYPWVRHGHGSDLLNDIDRVFQTLDGKKHHPGALVNKMNEHFRDNLHEGQPYEDELYRIKGFKNGNMHIEFKRQDLLDKANRIIHDYYKGQALAEGPAAV
jgi:hypothetical protein